MSYTPTDWVDGTTPVNAANLDKMEAGIVAAHAPFDGRLGATAKQVTDWNNAIEDGWYFSQPDQANNPPLAGFSMLGLVSVYAAGYVTQDVWSFADPVGTLPRRWLRRQIGGTWDAWVAAGEIPAAIEYENVWSAGVSYQAGDVVTYNGVSYLAVNDSVGSTPPTVNAEVLTISGKTASYTPVAADAGTMLDIVSATGVNLTVPADATVNFAVGTQIHFLQAGAGQITVAAAGGVTVNARPGLKTAGLWASGTLLKRAANNWVCLGNMVP